MLTMGKTKPLSIKKGRIKKNVVIMACCCVEETVEIKRPTPRVERRKRHVAIKSRMTLPDSGISNQTTAMIVTATICRIEMII